MRGYLIITHGPLACALIESVEMIAGKIDHIAGVSLEPSDGIETLTAKINDKFSNFSTCEEVFVLTDLLGGSPSNTAFACLSKFNNVHFITGVNFPMLLTLVLTPEISVDEMMQLSKDGIVNVREYSNSMMYEED